MQISTRTEDYIVDIFKLWDHIGPYLRELFKDPKKKKVFSIMRNVFSTEFLEYS
jgi:hypothetical protein